MRLAVNVVIAYYLYLYILTMRSNSTFLFEVLHAHAASASVALLHCGTCVYLKNIHGNTGTILPAAECAPR